MNSELMIYREVLCPIHDRMYEIKCPDCITERYAEWRSTMNLGDLI